MKLYELQKEDLALEKLYLMSIDEETGELIDGDIIKELELELRNKLINKSVGLIKFIKNGESYLDAVINERKRLQTLEKMAIKKLDNFKNYIKFNMEAMGLERIETGLGKLILRTSSSVELNEEIIDPKYGTKIETIKFNKIEIGNLLKNGEIINGARILINKNLNIK